MMLRVLRYLAVTIAVIAVVVLAVGYSLPVHHVASREVLLADPPAVVFATLTDVERYPTWRTDVDRVELLSTSPLRWREHAGGDRLTFEVVESLPPEKLQVRIADPELPFGGTWTYDLSPDDHGSRLLIVERGEVYNPIFRLVSRYIFGYHASLDRFIEALRRRTP